MEELQWNGRIHRPPDYNEYGRRIEELAEVLGKNRVVSIGKTVLGKPILALCFGSRDCPALYLGGFHAKEWITTLVLLQFADELEQCRKCHGSLCGVDVGRALETKGVWIVPAVNLDGIDLHLGGYSRAGSYENLVRQASHGDLSAWQANIRGVDLNHNYNAGFAKLQEMEREQGITGPSPGQYGGPFPHSEPETRAVTELCERLQPGKVIAFHSQGEEIFYDYGPCTPNRSRLMAQVMAASSGYRVTQPGGLASHGGMKDWFIQEYCRPGFTVELGKGKNPLPISDLPGIYRRVRELLMLGILL